jgi:hypothetical protein
MEQIAQKEVSMVKGRETVDTQTGKVYPSQCAMVRDVAPYDYRYNHFYMYELYKAYPGRFTVSGVVQSPFKVHWDISTRKQAMVNCGQDYAPYKSRDLTKVTCKNCLRTVDMAPKRLVKEE